MMDCERACSIDEAIIRASEKIGSTFAVTSSNGCRDYSHHNHSWDAGLSAVLMIGRTEHHYYLRYHESRDTIDKVNIPYLRPVISRTQPPLRFSPPTRRARAACGTKEARDAGCEDPASPGSVDQADE